MTENKTNSSKEFVNVEQLSQWLGVSPKTIYYWVNHRKIPFIKIGRHLRFSPGRIVQHFEDVTRHSCFTYQQLVERNDPRSLKNQEERLAGKGTSNVDY